MKVMVTGAGALLGQGIIRSLRAGDLEVQIVAVDPSPLAAGLYWADSHHLIPLAREHDFIDRLREVVALEQPDVLIPGTDVELPILARERAVLEEEHGIDVLVSDPRVIALADDKFLTFEFLRGGGFPVPETCLPGDQDRLIGKVGFPLVVKPRIGARSVGVKMCGNRHELERALEEGGPGLMVQEAVATPELEFTAGTVTFDGRCQASIVMRRELRDGNTYRAWVEEYPRLNLEVRRLADALQARGPANFQFRLDRGLVKVFEINARFSGTTPLRSRAGFDEVGLCLRYLLYREPIVQPPVEPMVILRHWSETVVPADRLAGGD